MLYHITIILLLSYPCLDFEVNVFPRVLYIKFEETEERGENDLADCPGGNKVSHHCPWVTFSFKDLKDVDLTTSGTGICDA